MVLTITWLIGDIFENENYIILACLHSNKCALKLSHVSRYFIMWIFHEVMLCLSSLT